VKDLDRRLDLDFDALLESPKLNFKLSPAELDKQCLELYESLTDGPGGDLLRIIGGGNDVALQHRYLKRKARNELKQAQAKNAKAPFFLDRSADKTDEQTRTASQWVKLAMRRNLPTNGTFALDEPSPVPDDTIVQDDSPAQTNEKTALRMCRPQRPILDNRRTFGSRSLWGGVTVFPQSPMSPYARKISMQRSARGLSLLI
jgi:hypothetical protein